MPTDFSNARGEYTALLGLLENDSKSVMKMYLLMLDEELQKGNADVVKLAKDLGKQYRALIMDAASQAFDLGVEYKRIEFQQYLSQVEKVLAGENISDAVKQSVTDRVKVVFDDNLKTKIVSDVWNKVWPDKLNIDDRIGRLVARVANITKQAVAQGAVTGQGAADVIKPLQDKLGIEGFERKAAFRLAAHTVNMVYQSTQAEISNNAEFVLGIRIVRGMWGAISLKCKICFTHGGDHYKEYFKGDYGGRDIELWVLANTPPYHSHCSCGIEQICAEPEKFIKFKQIPSNKNKTQEILEDALASGIIKKNDLIEPEWTEKFTEKVINFSNAGVTNRTWDNLQSRNWYIGKEKILLDNIDKGISLKEQAWQAFQLRNAIRENARDLMSDIGKSLGLRMGEPNMNWEEVVAWQIAKGRSGNEIWEGIIQGAQKSRQSVNKKLGIE